MPHRNNVLPGLIAPTTKSLREAVRNIIIDIQRESGDTDPVMAMKLDISVGTLRNWRDKHNDAGALTIAKMGHEYGASFIAPYQALYADNSDSSGYPTIALNAAVSALLQAKGLKGELDALPAVKAAIEAAQAFVTNRERERMRLVS